MKNDPRGHSKYRRIAKSVVGVGRPCHWCGAPATTADHLVPVSIDPSRAKDRSNLVPACARCNQSRGNRAAPKALTVVGRSVFSRGNNDIPALRQISLPMRGYSTIRGDFSRK